MESAIQTLVKVYLKSSKGKESLGKKDFQNLVKSQLGNILSGTDSKEAINTMAVGLDENHDGKLGFPEYMKLIGYLATSLSEQRTNEQEVQNATGQVANSSPDKEEKTEANAEVKAEPKAEGTEAAATAAAAAISVPGASISLPSADLKVEAPKGELPNLEAEVEVKAERDVPNEAAALVTTMTTTTTEVTEEVNGEVTKVTEVTEVTETKEEVTEEVKEETVEAGEAPAAEEKTEEKTEETTS